MGVKTTVLLYVIGYAFPPTAVIRIRKTKESRSKGYLAVTLRFDPPVYTLEHHSLSLVEKNKKKKLNVYFASSVFLSNYLTVPANLWWFSSLGLSLFLLLFTLIL
jgi:hypothetical protein